MAKEFQLTHDPVFQLNSCIWLVRKTPTSIRSPKPLLAEQGFVLRALGQKLGVAPDLQKIFREMGWSPTAPEPDVMLNHAASGNHLVIECKAHSFAIESSNTKQARKLLAVCAQPGVAVGIPPDSPGNAVVLYAVPAEDAELQRATLEKLIQEFAELGLSASQSGTLALSIEEGGLWAEIQIINIGPDSDLKGVCRRLWITDGDDEDARPLYLIPYDPTAVHNQVPSERDYCAKMLTERIITYAQMIIGRSDVPDVIRIYANDALRYSTSDISDRWQARELGNLRRRIAQGIGSTLNKGELRDKVRTTNTHVEITLASLDEQQVALGFLRKAQIQHIAMQLVDGQVQLVDED